MGGAQAPLTDPHDRRLAVKVEDHPLEYASFEGTIPEGGYGAGAVIVWDGGVYDNLRRDPDGGEVPMSQAIEDGHVEVFLEGRKLRGAYALTRIGDSGATENWLLVKMRDSYAGEPLESVADARSILSGRSLDEVAGEPRKQEEPREEPARHA